MESTWRSPVAGGHFNGGHFNGGYIYGEYINTQDTCFGDNPLTAVSTPSWMLCPGWMFWLGQ